MSKTEMQSKFPDRVERLDKILQNTSVKRTLPLFREACIPYVLSLQLQEHCHNYILSSLRAANSQKDYTCFPGDLVDIYKDDILALPNKTPNGLILPKKDNFLAYNELHRTVCNIFKTFNIDEHVKTIHAPINIRVINGVNSSQDSRPRASSKLHSDIWAGEFTDTVMLFLTVMGDLYNNGIEFYDPPRRFYDEFCRPLNDYLEGSELEKESQRYDCMLDDGFAYFTDPFLLHRTIKKAPSLRISIDFRFIPHHKCETDKDVETERHKNYISLEDWYKIGSTSLLYTDVTVAESRAENIGPKNAYAADYTIRSLNEC